MCLLACRNSDLHAAQSQELQAAYPGGPHGAGDLRVQPVGVFGDGDLANGAEDGRVGFSAPDWRRGGLPPKNPGAGTIRCDGKVRGSATVVDPGEHAIPVRGVVLVTAAHVIFDLQTGARFGQCEFRFKETGRWRVHRLDIDLDTIAAGSFDPAARRNSAAFGQGDWAFLFVPGPVPAALRGGGLRLRPFASLPRDTARYSLVAYHADRREVLISPDCRVVESTAEDIGGGGWPGQLLDDCDSGDGASGGALLASVAGRHFLVGLRVGAYWDRHVFPAAQYPGGPPAGAVWEPGSNTNFSRSVDPAMLGALGGLLERLVAGDAGRTVF
jgi:hypothetical protein